MLHHGFETEKSQSHARDIHASQLLTSILGLVIGIIGLVISAIPVLAWIGPVTREAVLHVAEAIAGLSLTTLLVGWTMKRRTAAAQVKATIRTAYASALAGSPLNPEREALGHGG